MLYKSELKISPEISQENVFCDCICFQIFISDWRVEKSEVGSYKCQGRHSIAPILDDVPNFAKLKVFLQHQVLNMFHIVIQTTAMHSSLA